MTMRFGSIIIHKPDPNSDGNHSSSDDTEVAEIAETAVQKYSTRGRRDGSAYRKRSERQRRMMAKESQRNLSRRSSSSSISSNELPILRGLSASDKSEPLNRSHYSFPAAVALIEDRLAHETKDSLKNKSRSRSHSQSPPISRRSSSSLANVVEDLNNERLLGFKVLTVGSSRTSLDLPQRRPSTVSTDTRLSIATNNPTIPENFFDEEEEEESGLVKLLKNLNFAEKRRREKAERERLNIQKLPSHMKEQLKHIYVY